jgi:hypothetical protein
MTDTFHLRTITYLPIGLVLNHFMPPLSPPEYSLNVGSRKLGGYPAAQEAFAEDVVTGIFGHKRETT